MFDASKKLTWAEKELMEQERVYDSKGRNIRQLAESRQKVVDKWNLILQPHAEKDTTYEKWVSVCMFHPEAWTNQCEWIDYYPTFINSWKVQVGEPAPTGILFPNTPTKALLQRLLVVAVVKKQQAVVDDAMDKTKPIMKIAQRRKNLFDTNWTEFTPGDKAFMIAQWKLKYPNYTADRLKLYNALMRDNVGTPYAGINNIMSYLTINDNPPLIGKGIQADEDNYYEVLIPEAATILWWYDKSKTKHTWFQGTLWYERVAIPRPTSWASRKARVAAKIVGDNSTSFFISGTIIAAVGVAALAFGLTL